MLNKENNTPRVIELVKKPCRTMPESTKAKISNTCKGRRMYINEELGERKFFKPGQEPEGWITVTQAKKLAAELVKSL